jgi:hypothetical protein
MGNIRQYYSDERCGPLGPLFHYGVRIFKIVITQVLLSETHNIFEHAPNVYFSHDIIVNFTAMRQCTQQPYNIANLTPTF